MKTCCLFMLLSMGICFGQAKKTNQSKKENSKSEKVVVEERNPNTLTDSQDAPVFDEGPDNTTPLNASSAEVKPTFPGGEKNFYMYFSKNFHYPEDMIDTNLKGQIIASFIVEKDGSITDIKIVRGLHVSTDKEVLRVLKMMPKWLPAEQNGKKVRCSFMVPISVYASN
ncbi:energy transducer TonB [Flavobacterium aciduliphilum]|uniref:Outer membrane transport energization protein TonB n=1 Tax=Flavobacterium aciduliphilum TaxID=1101402 RepID=A0A328YRF8_9FLAO|nr:energy transducer TonB [Flavobacterium aciduliphilum]RAR75375.1 outer membrane transport energization protein TonB [Flavobacterium aciduliphilum]